MTRLAPLRPGLRLCCGPSLTLAINCKCAAQSQCAAPGLALPDYWLAHWLPCRPFFNGSFSAALFCSSAAAETAKDTRADVQSTLAPASALLRLPFLMLSLRALPLCRRPCACWRIAQEQCAHALCSHSEPRQRADAHAPAGALLGCHSLSLHSEPCQYVHALHCLGAMPNAFTASPESLQLPGRSRQGGPTCTEVICRTAAALKPEGAAQRPTSKVPEKNCKAKPFFSAP